MLGWVAAATIGSSLIGADAASSAADAQSQAAANAQAQQLAMFNTQNNQLAPQRAVGYSGLNAINSMLPGTSQTYDAQGNPTGTQTGSGYLTHQFNNQDLNANLAPNYDFQLRQGQQALNAQNNATGGLVGGNSLKSMQDYSQNFAGNAYQNAFSNYQAQRGNIYNTLAGIAGLGQAAQQTTAGLASNTTNAMGQLGVGSANAQAAGTIGSANAIGGGIQNLGNMNYLGNILKSSGNSFSNSSNYNNNDVYTGPGALPDTSGNYWSPSDRRLKKDIKLIGKFKNGLNKYSWTYLWGDKAEGAMADEVEKVIPEAVKTLFGYKAVNYALLGA